MLFDCRNHGESDHHTLMNYSVMADDLIRLADSLNIPKFSILGHSMGGKIAMTTACKYPERVEGVISVDAAPIDYNNSPNYISAILGITEKISEYYIEGMERKELFNQMNEDFGNFMIANLIMKNVRIKGSKVLGWKSNIPVLVNNVEDIFDYEETGVYTGPIKCILAENSKFTIQDYKPMFPI